VTEISAGKLRPVSRRELKITLVEFEVEIK
jgi:hypothetical protein